MDGRGDELGRSLPVLLLNDEQSRAGDRAIAGPLYAGRGVDPTMIAAIFGTTTGKQANGNDS